VILTGAGISVAANIPDFRSENGLFSAIEKSKSLKRFQLPSPHSIFDLAFFKHDPQPFFFFIKDFLPSGHFLNFNFHNETF
jgi:NAD-dependent SIR2 family protein deacetylase